jgi:uncharacterized repeat protein (TIGR01451 family)
MVRRKQVLSILLPVILILFVAAVPADAASFEGKVDFTTGVTPLGVAWGDLDGDGVLDLVVANGTSDSISVLLGLGDGRFGAKTDYAMGDQPIAVVVADLNRDGSLDVVTANASGNSASVRMGTRDGTLQTKSDYATGSNASAIAVGDVSGDGWPDLVTVNGTPSTASVLLGLGNGTFGAKTDFSTGAFPQAVALADFDRDGTLDIVAANYGTATVSVLFGSGGGSFDPRIDYNCGTNPTAIAVGDLNADGIPDVVTANFSADKTVSVLLGTAAGGFGMGYTDYAAPSGPSGIALADVDVDGDLDVLSANYTHNTVSVFLGDGTGALASRTDLPGGTVPFAVTAADLDRDGRADLVATNMNGQNVSVFLNSTVLAPSGDFASRTDFPIGSGLMLPRTVVLADLNRDGIPDAATANLYDSSVSVVPGTGGGSFGPSIEYITSPLTGTFPQYVASADLNRDGHLDLVVTNSKTTAPDIIKTVAVMLADGSGGFGAMTHYETADNPQGLALGDLNRDGAIDIAVACYGSNAVSVLLGTGVGTFGAKTDFPTANFPQEIAIADLNGDGRPDLATANMGVNRFVSVLHGYGNGTFTPHRDFQLQAAAGSSPGAIAIGDVNRDGHLDLVTANADGNTISVLLSDGAGGFGPSAQFTTGTKPRDVALGDLNGDAITDLVTANYDAGTLSVLHGTGLGSFGAKTEYAIHTNTYNVAIGDVNADGRNDLVAAAYSYGKLSVLLNAAPPAADLGVVLTATPATVSVGTTVTCTATVTNHGPGSATGVTLVSVLGGLSFVSATPSTGTCSGESPLTCGIGALLGGGTATVSIVATVNAVGGSVCTATVRGNVADGVASNDSAIVVRTAFTDDPLSAGVTTIKAAHLAELRAAIDLKRKFAGLPAGKYVTDPVLTPGATRVKAAHLNDACVALKAAHPAASCSTTVAAGQIVGAGDFAALRAAVRAVE